MTGAARSIDLEPFNVLTSKASMRSDRLCIVGIGELVWDHLPDATLPGGAPANFAYHSRQLGAEGVVVTAVGSDTPGDRLITWLADVGVDAGAVQRNCFPTGGVTVRLTSDGQPQYRIHEDAAWDHLEWTPALAALAKRADGVCVGSLGQRSPRSRETIRRFLAATRRDCLRMFDLNLREPHFGPRVLHETLDLIDVLKLNDEEWPFVADHFRLDRNPIDGCRALLSMAGLKMIALTRGAAGSVLITSAATHELPAPPVRVVDTVGAGDAFNATLCVGLLRGLPLTRVQAHATAVAGHVCTYAGATPSLPGELASFETPLATTHVIGAGLAAAHVGAESFRRESRGEPAQIG